MQQLSAFSWMALQMKRVFPCGGQCHFAGYINTTKYALPTLALFMGKGAYNLH